MQPPPPTSRVPVALVLSSVGFDGAIEITPTGTGAHSGHRRLARPHPPPPSPLTLRPKSGAVLSANPNTFCGEGLADVRGASNHRKGSNWRGGGAAGGKVPAHRP